MTQEVTDLTRWRAFLAEFEIALDADVRRPTQFTLVGEKRTAGPFSIDLVFDEAGEFMKIGVWE